MTLSGSVANFRVTLDGSCFRFALYGFTRVTQIRNG